jgi:hypothetical protein
MGTIGQKSLISDYGHADTARKIPILRQIGKKKKMSRLAANSAITPKL